jgi:hypothetical protein
VKNVIKLQNYYSPSELERAIAEWAEYYNNQRYHESLENVTPADVYFGGEKEIIKKRTKTQRTEPGFASPAIPANYGYIIYSTRRKISINESALVSNIL